MAKVQTFPLVSKVCSLGESIQKKKKSSRYMYSECIFKIKVIPGPPFQLGPLQSPLQLQPLWFPRMFVRCCCQCLLPITLRDDTEEAKWRRVCSAACVTIDLPKSKVDCCAFSFQIDATEAKVERREIIHHVRNFARLHPIRHSNRCSNCKNRCIGRNFLRRNFRHSNQGA